MYMIYTYQLLFIVVLLYSTLWPRDAVAARSDRGARRTVTAA